MIIKDESVVLSTIFSVQWHNHLLDVLPPVYSTYASTLTKTKLVFKAYFPKFIWENSLSLVC